MQKYAEFLKCDYLPSEITDMAKDLARSNQTRASLEQQKKQVDSQLKAQIEEQNTTIGRLSSAIANGCEWRNVECRFELDTPVKGKKRIVRLDTMEEVRIVTMTDEDAQMSLDLQAKAEAEEAAKNPPAEPIITPPPYVPRIDEPGVVEAAAEPVMRSLRLLRQVKSDLPFPPYLVAIAGVYAPDKIQVNAHGAVSVKTPNGWLGIKPDEMEWIDATEPVNGAPLAQAAVMGGTHQKRGRKPRDAKREAAADGSEADSDEVPF